VLAFVWSQGLKKQQRAKIQVGQPVPLQGRTSEVEGEKGWLGGKQGIRTIRWRGQQKRRKKGGALLKGRKAGVVGA